MAKKKAGGFDVSFDFGASAKPKRAKSRKGKAKKKSGKGGNAWSAYVGQGGIPE